LEIETCAPYLDRQILTIQPEFIVTLGAHSTAHIFSKATLPFSSITQARGKPRKTNVLGLPLTIFPTYHPASALYNPEHKKVLEHDFQLLKTNLQSIHSDPP
jgi:DNA polymerase